MVGLMEDTMDGGRGMQGMGPQRGVAVPQPQGANPIQILAQELQRTQAEVAQLKQIVLQIVQVIQGGRPQGAPQGGVPMQPQPVPPQAMAPQGQPMPGQRM